MEEFEVNTEELQLAARTVRSLVAYPPRLTISLSQVDLQRIRHAGARQLIAALTEKGEDNFVDLMTVILSLGMGLEKAAADYGMADTWNAS